MQSPFPLTRRARAMAVAPAIVLMAVAVHAAPPATGEELTFDCAQMALPSQAAVAALTGQHNFTQVYATRTRLMVQVRQACRQTGTATVRLVRREATAPDAKPGRDRTAAR